MGDVSAAAGRGERDNGILQRGYDQLFAIRELLLTAHDLSPDVMGAVEHIRLARAALHDGGAR